MKTLPKLSEYNKKIIENTKYRDKLDYREYAYNKLIDIENYTNFITQPLNLSHFVPAIEKDGKWIVLTHPFDDNSCDIQEYETALDKVVFKGCKIRDKGNFYFVDLPNSCIYLRILKKSKWTIEDIITHNLEVNENIIKKFGL